MNTLSGALKCLILAFTLSCILSAHAEDDAIEGRSPAKKEKTDTTEVSSRDSESKKPKKEKKEKSEKPAKTEVIKSSFEATARDADEKKKEEEEKEEAKEKPRRGDSEGIPSRAEGTAKSKRKKK